MPAVIRKPSEQYLDVVYFKRLSGQTESKPSTWIPSLIQPTHEHGSIFLPLKRIGPPYNIRNRAAKLTRSSEPKS